jgi:hypothetical protein
MPTERWLTQLTITGCTTKSLESCHDHYKYIEEPLATNVAETKILDFILCCYCIVEH